MKNLTWQNPEQLFVAQELINKVKSKCCGIKDNNVNLSDLEAIDSTPTSSGNNYKEANDKKREERKEKERQNNFKKNDKLVNAAYSKCEDNIIDMYVNPEHYSNLSKEEFRHKYKDLQKKLKKIRTDHEQKTGSKYYVSEYETKACPV